MQEYWKGLTPAQKEARLEKQRAGALAAGAGGTEKAQKKKKKKKDKKLKGGNGKGGDKARRQRELDAARALGLYPVTAHQAERLRNRKGGGGQGGAGGGDLGRRERAGEDEAARHVDEKLAQDGGPRGEGTEGAEEQT